ncbi:hypothetical protein KP509_03G091700 [Ceratopteris richardii]|uniref:Uncharacterized protein n=1 Tax=Ceratopteris richardii TaxID=49495 RepID=A0A8T2V234_CERRI|nr:hypothetical protein KP509_03G091700 [Ceratopteris richardii]
MVIRINQGRRREVGAGFSASDARKSRSMQAKLCKITGPVVHNLKKGSHTPFGPAAAQFAYKLRGPGRCGSAAQAQTLWRSFVLLEEELLDMQQYQEQLPCWMPNSAAIFPGAMKRASRPHVRHIQYELQAEDSWEDYHDHDNWIIGEHGCSACRLSQPEGVAEMALRAR